MESLASRLQALSPELAGPDFEKGLAVGVWAAQAMVVERMFIPAEGPFEVDDDDLVERLTELVCHSAGIDARARVRR